jgi:nucleotide-binding universal stress UspA family protein
MIARILVPLDGSALSESALGIVDDLVRGPGREVELLRVVPSGGSGLASFAAMGVPAAVDPAWDAVVDQQVGEARAYLASVARRLPAGTRVRTAVRVGEPPVEIALRARQGAFDMIVMSTHGRTGLGRWVMGSVADAVAHRTVVPVLLIHPDMARAVRDADAAVDHASRPA